MASSGMAPGHNLPPGEVYVVPRDGEGQVAVNGSLPGKLLAQGEDLILTFRDGRLAEMAPENGSAAQHLRATQIAYAERRGDANWPNLAEIGFGLNPAILELTGAELVDGKKAHTLHVGLGNSVSLGGVVESVIHCDMIVRRPTVYVNGHLIMKRGDWRVNEIDWRLDHRTAAAPSGWWDGIAEVRRSGIRTSATRAAWSACGTLAAGGGIRCRSATRRPLAWLQRVDDVLPEHGGALDKDDVLALAAGAGPPLDRSGPALGDAPIRSGAFLEQCFMSGSTLQRRKMQSRQDPEHRGFWKSPCAPCLRGDFWAGEDKP